VDKAETGDGHGPGPGMIHVVINEGRYDKTFVENWTVGFDELRAHVQEYSPQRVSEITWVPAETIADAARVYATHRPAAVLVGNANENIVLSMQTQRAIYILEGLCGNVGAPGGKVQWTAPPLLPELLRNLLCRILFPGETAKETGRRVCGTFHSLRLAAEYCKSDHYR